MLVECNTPSLSVFMPIARAKLLSAPVSRAMSKVTDYSKFDHIVDSDEEEDNSTRAGICRVRYTGASSNRISHKNTDFGRSSAGGIAASSGKRGAADPSGVRATARGAPLPLPSAVSYSPYKKWPERQFP